MQKFDTIKCIAVLSFKHVASIARCNHWVSLSTVNFKTLSNIENEQFFSK